MQVNFYSPENQDSPLIYDDYIPSTVWEDMHQSSQTTVQDGQAYHNETSVQLSAPAYQNTAGSAWDSQYSAPVPYNGESTTMSVPANSSVLQEPPKRTAYRGKTCGKCNGTFDFDNFVSWQPYPDTKPHKYRYSKDCKRCIPDSYGICQLCGGAEPLSNFQGNIKRCSKCRAKDKNRRSKH